MNCIAIKVNGLGCTNRAKPNSNLCGVHRNYMGRLPAQQNIPEYNEIEPQHAIPPQNEIIAEDQVIQIIQQAEVNENERIKDNEGKIDGDGKDGDGKDGNGDGDDEKSAIEEVKEYEAMSKITTCKCCYDDSIPNDQLIRCSKANSGNEHFICGECIVGSIKSQISTGVASFGCMLDTHDNSKDACGGVIPFEVFKDKLDEETLNKLSELVDVKNASEQATKVDNYQLCPFCSRSGCVLVPPAIGDCTKCGKKWCATCRREEHGSRHCYELEFKMGSTLRDRCNMIDRMIHEIMTNQTSHKCPSCKATFIKEEGCNKITCNKCKAYSCYICGELIPHEVGYHHFGASKGLCELWPAASGGDKTGNGNIQYTRTQIHKELEKFIEMNDEAYQRIIIGRIENYYKQEKSKEAVAFIKRLLDRLSTAMDIQEKQANSNVNQERKAGKARVISLEQQAKDECKVS